MSSGCTIHWFRKGLRLHDNPGLLEALKPVGGCALPLKAVFMLDPWFVKKARVGANRWRFLIQSLQDLDGSLKKLGSRLFVVKGSPEELFPKLIKKWGVKLITWEEDTEPYALARDQKIREIAKSLEVSVVTFSGHTLYDPGAVISKNKGEVPLTYVKFQSVVAGMEAPAKPLDPPEVLTPGTQLRSSDLTKEKYDVPSIGDILKTAGLSEANLGPCKFPGGETESLRRLMEKVSKDNKNWVRNFEKPNTSPNSIEPSTTVLSPYLKFGCLSPRTMYWQLFSVCQGAKHSQPPVSLQGQLLWREFFYTCSYGIPNFGQMKGNRICKQIDWDSDPEKLAAWREARTGFPYIDAIMTQLKEEGWIHHLARHSVACFLTRGDLYQSWERGVEVFEELLLDADYALNAGNWMWLSASAFFHQYFRVYSPTVFGKKTDPDGLYIKKYLPQLAKYPAKYIYSPWEAPLAVQKAAGCIIGEDYPRPIVKHEIISKENIGRMKRAYDAGKSQDDGSDSPAAKPKKQKTLDSFVAKKK